MADSLWDDLMGMVPGGAGGFSTAMDVGARLYAGNQAASGQRADQNSQQGNLNAINSEMAQGRAATAPGTSYLRSVVATPAGQLTPAEQQGLGVAQKQEETQLATSGLRGAGQAQLDAMRQLQGNYVGNAVQSNIQRQDQAGSALSGENAGMYGRTAFPTTIGASGAGAAASRAPQYTGAAALGSAGMTSAALGGAFPGAAMGALNSYINAENKGAPRYTGSPLLTAGNDSGSTGA